MTAILEGLQNSEALLLDTILALLRTIDEQSWFDCILLSSSKSLTFQLPLTLCTTSTLAAKFWRLRLAHTHRLDSSLELELGVHLMLQMFSAFKPQCSVQKILCFHLVFSIFHQLSSCWIFSLFCTQTQETFWHSFSVDVQWPLISWLAKLALIVRTYH